MSTYPVQGQTLGSNILKYDQTSEITGVINGANALFTVSTASYVSDTLVIILNGQVQVKGTSFDWVETNPGIGTFSFNTAPQLGDLIECFYLNSTSVAGNTQTLGGVNSTNYALKTGVDDLEITDFNKGVILKSPNATRWRITVNNMGTLIITSL